MKVVLDTNVLISGVFFAGLPLRILEAWRDGRVDLVISPAILEEYRRVGERLAAQFEGLSLEPFLMLLATHSEIVEPPDLIEPVASDPDDDKFLACALISDAQLIISGDKHLLAVSPYNGVKVVSPRQFVESYL
ncbi:MAG: putative toxin-antitoxin system toxin component, PIN family [Thermoanaerobaculia bacterium]